VITFLMVFLIQNTQTRDNAALQTKLDELIRSGTAENSFVGIEHLSDEELEALRRKCEERARAVDGEVKARRSKARAPSGGTRPAKAAARRRKRVTA
jgi:low affinity Fe/Cu permease